MSDSRILSAERLAEIESRRVYGDVDQTQLLAHAAALTERLAEAERNYNDSRQLHAKTIDVSNTAIADLRAQLATAQATNVEKDRAISWYKFEQFETPGAIGYENAQAFAKAKSDLATERSLRLAAEGREAELRTALEVFADGSNWQMGRWGDDSEPSEVDQPFWYWERGGDDEPFQIALDALAAHDIGAGAVLAAADWWEEASGQGQSDYDDAKLDLGQKVRAWRARREGV